MNTSTDEAKGQYIAQACNFCKTRHLKCDGVQPCVQCSLRKQDCVYTTPTRKRGRKPKSETQNNEKSTKKQKNLRISDAKGKFNDATLKEIRHTRNHKALIKKIEEGNTRDIEKDDILDILQLFMHENYKLKSDLAKGKHDVVNNDFDSEIKDIDYDLTTDFGAPLQGGSEGVASILIKAYSNRNAFLYPPGTSLLDSGPANEMLIKINVATEFKNLLSSDISILTDAYCYGIVFMFGCLALGRWNLGYEYSKRCDKIFSCLLKKKVHQSNTLVTKLLSYMTFQVMFFLGRGDIDEARNCIFSQYALLNANKKMISQSITYGVIGYMAALSSCVNDRLHWIRTLETVNNCNMSPYTDVIRCVLISGGVLYNDDFLIDLSVLKKKPSEEEIVMREKVYSQVQISMQTIETRHSYIFSQKSTVISALKHILMGTQALASLLVNKSDDALALAQKTIYNVRHVDTSVYTVLQLIANAYSVQTAIALRHRDSFLYGMEGIKMFIPILPLAHRVWNKLNEQGRSIESDYIQGYHQPHEITPYNIPPISTNQDNFEKIHHHNSFPLYFQGPGHQMQVMGSEGFFPSPTSKVPFPPINPQL